jgi:hypothetical protein
MPRALRMGTCCITPSPSRNKIAKIKEKSLDGTPRQPGASKSVCYDVR